ncbi:type II secretion system protein N [Noviherbaspirillum denitrificans]|uniref:Type II secretion system protein N n=1 Tax=Noviherbaspirillum denitrificans TaxID=1968433 RepID=A0A254T8C4_9BURK|nr:type II secretion system protein N [Noviherbaspirillum denitrificans]OWW18889.1 general secretion pathway protein GspN [Noviherbaspirillum denitrificans]
MRRLVIWLLAGTLAMVLTLLAFCPAAWMAALVESQSGGRLALGDAQGTLWRGSAFVGGAPSGADPVTPLLPGRFAWHLSPMVLLGQVDVDVENAEALSQPLKITGDWFQWQVSPAAVTLPAERLAGLGAPLNTIQPSGRMQLSWTPLQVARQGNAVEVAGTATLRMEDIASRLSPVKPLGAYQLIMDWRGRQAQLALTTIKGPMLLSGNGTLTNGRLQFSGKAEAEAGQEERLANLLNLLGQRRREGDKDVIALEFK